MKPPILLPALLLLFTWSCKQSERYIDFGNDRVYYEKPVTQETAQQVGEFLKAYRYFIDNGAVVQLVNDTSFVVRFATVSGVENDPYIIDGFVDMQIDLSLTLFNGERVDMQLCDSTMRTKGTITFDDAKAWIDGRAYVESDGIKVQTESSAQE